MGSMESATTWTLSQPYGIANVGKWPPVRQLLRKGQNLPTAPAQIRWHWYPQGPQVSGDSQAADPFSTEFSEGISTFHERFASSLSYLLLHLSSNGEEVNLPEKGATEATSYP